ncbi:MAG: SDR family oxidoreductase [Pseudomonadales bacterium]|nr:SDR family oxidoreductase [Pseudomonadales bacterium]
MQHIFITGGSGGMGLATGRKFADAGWFVGLVDVDDEGLEAAQTYFDPSRSFFAHLDVRDASAYEAVMQDFASVTNNRLDIMFNNAGIAPGGWFDEMPLTEIQRIIDINVMGVINGIQTAIPLLKATENSLCISTSSSVATHGHAMRAVYSASKSAVKGLTEALSLEFERFGIRTADVLPGCIDTPMLRSALAAGNGGVWEERLLDRLPQTGAYRLVPVTEIAETVWQAYHSDQIHWYVPKEVGDIDKLVGLDFAAARQETKDFLFPS